MRGPGYIGVVLWMAFLGLSAWAGPDLTPVGMEQCRPGEGDYSFAWWAQGWPERVKEAPPILNLQSASYGLAIHVPTVAIRHLGGIAPAGTADEVARADNQAIEALPPANLRMLIKKEGKEYRCRGSQPGIQDGFVPTKTQLRMINIGRYIQRVDIVGLFFTDSQGERFPGSGRLEIIAAPDHVALILEVYPDDPAAKIDVSIELATSAGVSMASLPQKEGELCPRRGIVWWPKISPDMDTIQAAHVAVEDEASSKPLAVAFDPARQWYDVALPEKHWSFEDGQDHPETFALRLENPLNQPVIVRLFFHAEYLGAMTGLVPLVLDEQGRPSGIPVQISKNWHSSRADGSKIAGILYQGNWFHGFTLLRLPARSVAKGQLRLICGYWGGVPAAAHAQLCLVGWGVNQLWDQAAIGNWGESICYDPDVNLNRSMIDDIRPLMVTPMAGPETKWNWTTNVGGGDFLVYEDEQGHRQPLVRVKTHYQAYGPNLTEATYTGITADGKIKATMTVSTPRVDDLNRAYHTFRYEVLKPMSFRRLAFYQLGADGYNDHQFGAMAYGQKTGLTEAWPVEKGGRSYHRQGLTGSGPAVWFSLHEAFPRAEHKGASANRGLIVRQWKARLGGKDISDPVAAVYGTENGLPSSNVELTPPPGLTTLQPGDYLEAMVELVIVPQFARDYYGPNAALKQLLAEGENTWKPVWHLAAGNDLAVAVTRGTQVRAYPPVLAVDSSQIAEFAIEGGLGSYVPVTFTGIKHHAGYELRRRVGDKTEPLPEEMGKFWQTDFDPATGTYRMTFNLLLEAKANATQRFIFRRS